MLSADSCDCTAECCTGNGTDAAQDNLKAVAFAERDQHAYHQANQGEEYKNEFTHMGSPPEKFRLPAIFSVSSVRFLKCCKMGVATTTDLKIWTASAPVRF